PLRVSRGRGDRRGQLARARVRRGARQGRGPRRGAAHRAGGAAMTTPGSNLLQRDVAVSGACTPHVLVIDNWDSFTFNLVQALRGLGAAITVRENDRCAASDLEALAPTHVVVSPGPGRPEDAGGTLQVLAAALER